MQPHHLHTLGTILPLFVSTALGQLSPWQVTNLQTWQPSGRPGSSPDYYVHVNVTNPDVADGEVYCQIVWQYPNVPYNQILDCEVDDTDDSTAWAWTIELLQSTDANPSPTTNFDLRWRAAQPVSNSTVDEEGVQIWTGTGQFEVAENMQGLCAASGFCTWALRPESTPVSIEAESISCSGSVYEALHDPNCGDEEAD
ncbi:hypothetical protein F4678DRAFT_466249 [Xylaria arbuscula]|nr:hypothetical protein F4678DRAFT_466249 [Xylaria arbuscula]